MSPPAIANLGQNNGVYLVRFRYQRKEYKKSLKVRDRGEAANAKNLVEATLHRLGTGQVRVPEGVDPGDFIVNGGTLTTPKTAAPASKLLTASQLVTQ